MNKFKIIFFIGFLWFGSNLLWAQQDFKSVLKDSIAPDGYLYHKITDSDNLKSISKLYNISKGQIKRLNPIIRRGFKSGMLIKLPANLEFVKLINQYKATKTRNRYVVQHQDTKYGISKLYGVSILELERLNPKIRIGLQEGDTIFVPKTKMQTLLKEDQNFFIHLVVKGDTFYSLIRNYNVTKSELLLLNPDLNEGLKTGMYLRIPKEKIDASPRSLTVFADSINKDKQLRVLFLLPFKSSLDSVPFDNISTISKLRNIVTDFYFGAKMAIDSLRNQGADIKAVLYDTHNSIDSINMVLSEIEPSQYNVVVGPLFTKNISYIQQKFTSPKTFILSPFSIAAKAANTSESKIVQEKPLQSQFTKKVINYVSENYTNQKLIIVTDSLPSSIKRYNLAIQKLALNDSINLDSIIVVKPEDGYIKKEVYQEQLDTITKGKNWVLNLSTSSVLIADTVNNLGVLAQESYDITMFTVSKGKMFKNLSNNYLARLNLYFPSDTYTDYTLDEVKNFEHVYLLKYNNLPTDNAFKGFDMVYDALSRLLRNDALINNDKFGISRRTIQQFDYIKDFNSNKIFNRGIFLLKYQGLSIKMVE